MPRGLVEPGRRMVVLGASLSWSRVGMLEGLGTWAGVVVDGRKARVNAAVGGEADRLEAAVAHDRLGRGVVDVPLDELPASGGAVAVVAVRLGGAVGQAHLVGAEDQAHLVGEHPEGGVGAGDVVGEGVDVDDAVAVGVDAVLVGAPVDQRWEGGAAHVDGEGLVPVVVRGRFGDRLDPVAAVRAERAAERPGADDEDAHAEHDRGEDHADDDERDAPTVAGPPLQR